MKFLFALFFVSLPAHAAVFDASDILPERAAAISGFGELLLSDPSSEGVEGRARFGLTDSFNGNAIIGTGSKNKGFRLGAETVYNLLGGGDGSFGFSGLASAIYIKRATGGLQFRLAPIVHVGVTGWNGLPAQVYASLPFYVEARSGSYTSASQLVLGSTFDVSNGGRYYVNGEGGIRLARAESYVLLGFGVRLGELRFDRRESRDRSGSEPSRKQRGGGEKEYRDEDFQ